MRIASLWNVKARLWVRGRRNWKTRINGDNKITGGKIVWMHCASLGEFEQGRPLLEKIKQRHPEYTIVLTFFSPSGYEIRKNYNSADAVYYLPMDGKQNAKYLINAFNPSLVIWIKYEFWFYYLTELKRKKIPVLLVSGIFREGQPFFKWYGGIWKKMLGSFYKIFVQNEDSLKILKKYGLGDDKVTVSGDTRFDRVIEIAKTAEPLPQAIIDFCSGKKVLVAGSTWIDDEKVLLHYAKVHPEIIFIIAPHEIHKENLRSIKKYFSDSIFYSEMIVAKDAFNKHVLIIDNIGMLSRLYKLADITYVGGGFGDDGIHNITEAAVYGKPVIFGPVYEKFEEANGLIECGGAFSINNAIELEALLNKLFTNFEGLLESSNQARNYVYNHQGATKKIMSYVEENRLLTN